MISFLLPTCHRPVLLDKMLTSLWETTRGYLIETVLVIDEDSKSYDVAHDHHVNILDWSTKKRGALWAWNRALELSTGDILVPCGDDQVFHEGWLAYALTAHRGKLGGYGVVGMNDLAYNGNTQVATMWLFDRGYCKDIMGGIFAPPMYHYYCVDSEWNEKAKALGRFVWEEQAKVEHLHSAHGKRPVDALDLEKQNWMEEDNQTFRLRKVLNFPITWEPLI